MAAPRSVFCVVVVIIFVLHTLKTVPGQVMTVEEVHEYREQVRSMFQHAYDGYLRYAYPYDELQPLTCDGTDTWGRCEDVVETEVNFKNDSPGIFHRYCSGLFRSGCLGGWRMSVFFEITLDSVRGYWSGRVTCPRNSLLPRLTALYHHNYSGPKKGVRSTV
ncbi:EDEM2 [Branchiostoma lanceolatum]|uniref:EDEM2 protein n=1 Tax=Branchiostoma lanceolatum TaxID=7740 RepID=A0A8K0A3X9_BRALA|nr:EDEM2 [Branchiostoma lanceolatum]